MNEITLAKEQFATALKGEGLDVYAFLPERIVPPVVVINTGNPFITVETIGNEYVMSLELILVAGTATNESATETLEQLIESVLKALPSYARLLRVDKPYSLAYNNAEYVSTSVQVELSITI
jgi:hypothetical protein